MTESQLLLFPEFRRLPIYDAGDPQANTLTGAVEAGAYRAVRGCMTVDDVFSCLRSPELVPLGGLRTMTDGGSVIVAYFGEKE